MEQTQGKIGNSPEGRLTGLERFLCVGREGSRGGAVTEECFVRGITSTGNANNDPADGWMDLQYTSLADGFKNYYRSTDRRNLVPILKFLTTP